ncbi:MAG: DEAD/DEAH box helicase [Verrucomicrobiota bacterium]
METTTLELETSGFAALPLIAPLQRALAERNYTQPSPIQAQAIPHLLQGKDFIGIAQTGTGKTAAFALPILQRLSENPAKRQSQRPRALILAPTRELAAQINESFETYGKHTHFRTTVVFGGVGYGNQLQELRRGVDILIATPGRLLDLAQEGAVRFDSIEIFVLDEADRMLDMGFVHDVKRVLAKLPAQRQSMLFSATIPSAIEELANSFLNQPVRVAVTPTAATVDKIDQRVCHVDRANKHALLLHLLNKHQDGLVLVFAETKHGANRLAERLTRDKVPAEAIHGNKSQGARQRALDRFKAGDVRVLVATDIASRGIDVKGISLVINFDLPHEPESYVHRIGRTARAGAEGMAISFCSDEERTNLKDIQRLIRKLIPVLEDHPFAIADFNRPSETSMSHRSFERRPFSGKQNRRPNRFKRTATPRANGLTPAQPNPSRGASHFYGRKSRFSFRRRSSKR